MTIRNLDFLLWLFQTMGLPEKKPLRYAHSEGQCDLCYNESGDLIVTGGSEGDIRLWRDVGDELDTTDSHRVGDKVLSVSIRNNKLYTAVENNTIQVHSIPDMEPDGLVTRFTAPVNHMSISRDGQWLVAGAGDFTVKLVSLTKSCEKIFAGHNAPILSVSLSPMNDFVSSSSCDGTVKIWDVKSEKCVRTIENVVKKCSDVSLSPSLCRMDWCGDFLLVPVGKEIHQLNRGEWVKIRSFDCGGDVSLVVTSPCQNYVAATTTDGVFTVWNFDNKKVILTDKHDENLAIASLKWHPKTSDQISYCDTSGQLGQICNVLSSNATNDNDDDGQGLTAAQYANLFADSDDDEDVKDTMDEGDINEALAEMDQDDDDSENNAENLPRPTTSMSDDVGSHASDGEDDVTSDLMKKPPTAAPAHYDCYQPTALQRPFQSSSTPAHLAQRFMVWNSVGIIRQYRNDDENSIDIEFHDTSVHHRMHVSNDLEHSIADLSTEAVALASDEDGTLVCMHFASWDNAKEWTITMLKGERITALTLGQGYVVAATDKRQVRLFTIGGLQK